MNEYPSVMKQVPNSSCLHHFNLTLPLNLEVFSLAKEREAKRRNMREPLGTYLLVLWTRWSNQKLMASHWIGMFKGPNVHSSLVFRLVLIGEWETPGFQSSLTLALLLETSQIYLNTCHLYRFLLTTSKTFSQKIPVQIWVLSLSLTELQWTFTRNTKMQDKKKKDFYTLEASQQSHVNWEPEAISSWHEIK